MEKKRATQKPFGNLQQKAPKKEPTLEEKALMLHKQEVAELAKQKGAIIIGIEEREKEVRTRTNPDEEPAKFTTSTVKKPVTFGTIGGKEYPVNVIVQAMNREGRKCSIAISDEVMNDPRLNLDLKNFLVALERKEKEAEKAAALAPQNLPFVTVSFSEPLPEPRAADKMPKDTITRNADGNFALTIYKGVKKRKLETLTTEQVMEHFKDGNIVLDLGAAKQADLPKELTAFLKTPEGRASFDLLKGEAVEGMREQASKTRAIYTKHAKDGKTEAIALEAVIAGLKSNDPETALAVHLDAKTIKNPLLTNLQEYLHFKDASRLLPTGKGVTKDAVLDAVEKEVVGRKQVEAYAKAPIIKFDLNKQAFILMGADGKPQNLGKDAAGISDAQMVEYLTGANERKPAKLDLSSLMLDDLGAVSQKYPEGITKAHLLLQGKLSNAIGRIPADLVVTVGDGTSLQAWKEELAKEAKINAQAVKEAERLREKAGGRKGGQSPAQKPTAANPAHVVEEKEPEDTVGAAFAAATGIPSQTENFASKGGRYAEMAQRAHTPEPTQEVLPPKVVKTADYVGRVLLSGDGDLAKSGFTPLEIAEMHIAWGTHIKGGIAAISNIIVEREVGANISRNV